MEVAYSPPPYNPESTYVQAKETSSSVNNNNNNDGRPSRSKDISKIAAVAFAVLGAVFIVAGALTLEPALIVVGGVCILIALALLGTSRRYASRTVIIDDSPDVYLRQRSSWFGGLSFPRFGSRQSRYSAVPLSEQSRNSTYVVPRGESHGRSGSTETYVAPRSDSRDRHVGRDEQQRDNTPLSRQDNHSVNSNDRHPRGEPLSRKK